MTALKKVGDFASVLAMVYPCGYPGEYLHRAQHVWAALDPFGRGFMTEVCFASGNGDTDLHASLDDIYEGNVNISSLSARKCGKLIHSMCTIGSMVIPNAIGSQHGTPFAV